MVYKYKHFIPQNTAPSGAKQIGVYDSNGNRLCGISLGRLTPVSKEKLYSFGLVSDIHLYKDGVSWVTWNPNTKFDNALTFFENQGCAMCIVCGDLTQTGLYSRTNDADPSTTYLDETQFAKYKEICDKHTIPVYEISGNHECYYGQPITNNLDRWEAYTGKGELSYTAKQGNDLFIMCGQPKDAAVMSDENFQWLGEILEANADKRCFVFVHSYIEEDSGDPGDKRENSIFESWSHKAAFMNLLRSYPNVVLFHGHSHMKFECQELYSTTEPLDAEKESYKAANYTEKNGFKSVHIPSLGRPRDITASGTPYMDAEAQGYIVDVYDDCIVLNGINFISNAAIPIGTYKIDARTR